VARVGRISQIYIGFFKMDSGPGGEVETPPGLSKYSYSPEAFTFYVARIKPKP